MCGINGIFNFNLKPINSDSLMKMRDSLEHRGPDSAGIFIEKNIGFGHRRLSIIDTSNAGNQPFYSENGRYVLVFNGEIYNYKSFVSELKSKGISLKTESDTEVLLKLYELYGLKMLSRLSGMFAFAIWDKVEQKLTLVRDRMGVKPLYYSIFEGGIYFASEQKALFTAGIPIKIDANGLEEYFYNRFTAGKKTLYQNVYKIVPGTFAIIDKYGNLESTKWWDLKHEIQNHAQIQNPRQWFEETFFNSIKLRTVADVPIGLLLSGGLDSCSVLSSLYHQGYKNIETFNIGFSQVQHNESYLAKQITEEYNYKFNSITVEGDLLYDNLIKSTYIQDEPITHLNEPHLLSISQLANKKVKVLLSGEGADELMGGYVRYKALKNPSLLKAISVLSSFSYLNKNPRYDKLFRYSKIKKSEDLILFNSTSIYPEDIATFYTKNSMPVNEYRYNILAEAKELYPKSLQRQALYFDQHTYMQSLLDRNDRTTMGASIECREPFLDEKLIAGLGTLPNKWLFSGKKGKFILKDTMQDKLPQEILNFKKIGLSSPWEVYLTTNNKLKEELELFAKSPIFALDFLENLKPNAIVDQVKKGNKEIIPYVMPIFMLHIWYKNYFEKFK